MNLTTTNTSQFVKIIILIAGGVASLSLIPYLIGSTYLSSYYEAIGASWVMGLFNNEVLIKEGSVIVVPIVFTAYLSVVLFLSYNFESKTFGRMSINLLKYSGLVAFLVGITALYFSYPIINDLVTIILVLAIQASLGFSIGEIIVNLLEDKLKWKPRHFLLIYLTLIFGNILIVGVGSMNASRDMSVTSSKLAYVTKKDDAAKEWRLLRTIGDKYLLVKLDEKKENRIFKLIPIDDSSMVIAHYK
ncbi:MAG: hypothetical protein WCE43_04130, partial [Burkholderiales bacterium]